RVSVAGRGNKSILLTLSLSELAASPGRAAATPTGQRTPSVLLSKNKASPRLEKRPVCINRPCQGSVLLAGHKPLHTRRPHHSLRLLERHPIDLLLRPTCFAA